MNHVWKLGRRGCINLVKDFNHFIQNECGNSSDIQSCASMYAKNAADRWKNYPKLNNANARETAQHLKSYYGNQISKVPGDHLSRSSVAQLAMILSMKGSRLVVRHRDNWSQRMQKNNGGMLPRGKRAYLWEELPAGMNNTRKEKAKPGTLNEEILFEGALFLHALLGYIHS